MRNPSISVRKETGEQQWGSENVLDDPLDDDFGHEEVSCCSCGRNLVGSLSTCCLHQPIFDAAMELTVFGRAWNVHVDKAVSLRHREQVLDRRLEFVICC